MTSSLMQSHEVTLFCPMVFFVEIMSVQRAILAVLARRSISMPCFCVTKFAFAVKVCEGNVDAVDG